MDDTIIKVENVGKLYRLGEMGTGTLGQDLSRWWSRVRGQEDPFLKIGETNDRTTSGNTGIVWALKDISFEVKKGEVLGIIGRNGAGKSTLLKILSKVTSPSSGQIRLSGRIASLLEVGTGFHPDLTGRENVFLNGAILGMSKFEIRSKFDEIVDFSGVERYIDTPIKRYSSGMYVRLAFAVAAFLEPEILIIDEVLTVGDAEFQKKCIGRMKDVSMNDGRTVLFVSHQMDAVARLCTRAIVLSKGAIEYEGNTAGAIKTYFNRGNGTTAIARWNDKRLAPGSKDVILLEAAAITATGEVSDTFRISQPVGIRIMYEVLTDNITFTHGINVYNENDDHLFTSHDVTVSMNKPVFKAGVYYSTAWIPGNLLAEGMTKIGVAIFNYVPFFMHFNENEVVSFSVIDEIDGSSARGTYGGELPGLVRPLLGWESSVSI